MKNNTLINKEHSLGIIFKECWKKSKLLIFITLIIIIISSVITVSAPFLFSKIIDYIKEVNKIDLSIIYMFLAYSVFMGASLTLQNTINYIAAILSEKLKFITAIVFFDNIVGKQPLFFIKYNPVEIQNIQSQGAQSINVLAQLGFMSIIPCLVQFSLTLLLIWYSLDLRIVLVVTVYGLIFIALTHYANKWIKENLQDAVIQSNKNAQLVGNAISNIDTLKYFNSTKWMRDKFYNGNESVFNNWRIYAYKRIWCSIGYGITLTIQFIITFYYLIPEYFIGKISLGTIVLFNMLLLQLNRPFEMVGMSIEGFVRSFTELKPFNNLLNIYNKIPEKLTRDIQITEGKLTLNDISFHYENSNGINNINFTITRGHINYLVGKSGAGKSTILKLILKFIEPDFGKIFIDQTPLSDITQDAWFNNIGVVPQEIMIMNETFKNNILLGRTYNELAFENALKKASLTALVNKLPEGIETNLGERGLTLSGGERQRIAIARAIYSHPKFLFLDEASSSLDENTEQEIMECLRALANEITIFSITHRISTIRPTDRVIEL